MMVGFLASMLKPDVRVIIKNTEGKVIYNTTAGAIRGVFESVEDWCFCGQRMVVIKIKGVKEC